MERNLVYFPKKKETAFHNVSMTELWTCCRHTRGRSESTHRGVLNPHTGGFQRATPHTPYRTHARHDRAHKPRTTTAKATATTTTTTKKKVTRVMVFILVGRALEGEGERGVKQCFFSWWLCSPRDLRRCSWPLFPYSAIGW